MAKSMALCLALVLALALTSVQADAQVKAAVAPAPTPVEVKEPPQMAAVEQSTESPIADMALIEDAPMVPKEKPPMAATVSEASASPASLEKPQPQAMEKSTVVSHQPHTVADFIIHPLIAFKPRQAALDELQAAQGKQANPAGSGSGGASTSPGTWLFGMNPGQGLGSSFSTLAGSVSGWFNDRLAAAGQQLPALQGLVDTPVRDSASTSTTSTTQRPDIVVRVQQRPNRRRITGNGNGNGNGNRNGNKNKNRKGNGNNNRVQRPNRFNNRLDSLESDEYDDDYFNGNRYQDEFEFDDDEQQQDDREEDEQEAEAEVEVNANANDDQSVEQVDDEEDEQPAKRRRVSPSQSSTALRRKPQSHPASPSSQRRQLTQQTRRGQPLALLEQAEDDEEDDDVEQETEDDDEEAEAEESEENYAPVIYHQSSRKSQGQPGFIQNGQQSLINQLRRFTFGQTPGELGNKLRKSPTQSQPPSRAGARRPQQATLLVNRNGQTVYVAPELLDLAPGYPGFGYAAAPVRKQQRVPASSYPQPPLTVPVRRRGRPTQYITIPWSQLGLSPPDRQSLVALAEGIQSQPLILNIPESAITSVPSGNNGQKKKKRPTLTAAAVPLLADASLMDIFQPPQIPPSRTGSSSSSGSGSKSKPKPVLIAAKPVQAGGMLPTRIRPGTIVEKAPAMDSAASASPAAQAEQQQKETAAATPEKAQMGMEAQEMAAQSQPEQEYIIVGEDSEAGLSRHVQPAFGDARYVSYGDFQPYFDVINHQNRRFALRKVGRALQADAEAAEDDTPVGQV